MLFKKDISLITKLSIDKTINEIKSITRQYGSRRNKAHMFEGKFSDNDFVLYPIFNFGQLEQLRPEIQGELIQQNNETIINLKYRLSSTFIFIFVFAIVFNLGVSLLLMLLSNMTIWMAPVSRFWWIIPLVVIVSIFIFNQYFDFKVSKSIRILKESIDAKTKD